MAKLGQIAEQTEKFLRTYVNDLGLKAKTGDWIAADFKNSSVEFQAELPQEVSAAVAQIFSDGLEVLADFDPESEGLNGRVSEAAALEYSKIGALIDPDEIIRMGVITPHKRSPHWRDITFTTLNTIRRGLEQPISSHGAIQGIVHAWFKEAREPHFQLRELATDDLVRVYYHDRMYDAVARAVQERSTTLMVEGEVRYDKVSRRPLELRAEEIKSLSMMTSVEFLELFGSAPNFEPISLGEEEWLN